MENLIKSKNNIIDLLKYQSNNIKTFVDENIVKGKKTDFITLDEVKNLYKADNFIRQIFPKISTFIYQLELELCGDFRMCTKRKTRKINGYIIREDYDINDHKAFML